MPFPNVIIPGGQKCGSSSLAYYLNKHPDCCLSSPKEPSFFSRQENLSDLSAYKKFFSKHFEEKIVFEASTGYLYEPYAARRIRDHLLPAIENLKIIIILRCPIERSISAYLHQKKRFDDKRSIEQVFLNLPDTYLEAASAEESEIKKAIANKSIDTTRYDYRYDDPLWQFRYMQNSWYPDKISAYIEYFGKHNVHFLSLENLNRTPQEEMSRIFKFLDIADYKDDEFGRLINPTYIPSGMDIFQATRWSPLNLFLKKYSKKILPFFGNQATAQKRLDNENLVPVKRKLETILSSQYEQLRTMTDLTESDLK